MLLLPFGAQAFGFDDVAAQARALAGTAYKAPSAHLPPELRDLDYDAYRDIRFKPDHALWRDQKLPFEIMFYYLGRMYQLPVHIDTVDTIGVEPVEFDPAMFDYGRNKLESLYGWEAGRIELVQIPTPDETNDNIIAYWVLDTPPVAKQPLDCSYRLHPKMDGQTHAGNAWVRQSRRGHGPVKFRPGEINFAVDFDGPSLRALGIDAKLQAAVSVGGNAELKQQNLFLRSGHRCLARGGTHQARRCGQTAGLRACLNSPSGDRVTETWSYIVPPESEKS